MQSAQLLAHETAGLPGRALEGHFDGEVVHFDGVGEGALFEGCVAGFAQFADLHAAFGVYGRGRGDVLVGGFEGDDVAVVEV